MSSSNSPCAACKFLRRKCTQECVFAPNFPPDQPQRFANVHRVFGASNVAKLLNEIHVSQREDAVNSLAYEAEARLRDPVYGCVALISVLQQRLKQVQNELYIAKTELSGYIGPSALITGASGGNVNAGYMGGYNITPGMMGLGPSNVENTGLMMDAQQLAAMVMKEEQELMRNWQQQQEQQQQQLIRFNNQMESLTIGGSGDFDQNLNVVYQENEESLGQLLILQQNEQQQQQQQQHGDVVAQAIPLHPQQQQLHQRSGSDEDRAHNGGAARIPHLE